MGGLPYGINNYTMKMYKTFINELNLGKAGSFAADKHSGQFRKISGEPYIVHPTAVVRTLQKLGVRDKEILVASFLHDTIEDTPTTFNEIKREFNDRVAKLVKELTSNDKAISKYGKPEYLAHKMLKLSDNALTIKLADRLHNITDIHSMVEKKARYLADSSLLLLDELNKRSLNSTHKKLVRMIRKQLEAYYGKNRNFN